MGAKINDGLTRMERYKLRHPDWREINARRKRLPSVRIGDGLTYAQRYALTHREQLRVKSERQRMANPEKARDACRKFYAENKVAELARIKKYYSYNKEKQALKNAKYKKKYPDRVKDDYLRRRFGLSLFRYEAMFVLQEGKCGICQNNFNHTTPHVDHDHENGVVRALLCRRCNTGLGQFRDCPQTLINAAQYVAFHAAIGGKNGACEIEN